MTPHKCPVCDGSGTIWNYNNDSTACGCTATCHACNGAGIVWETRLEEIGMDEYHIGF